MTLNFRRLDYFLFVGNNYDKKLQEIIRDDIWSIGVIFSIQVTNYPTLNVSPQERNSSTLPGLPISIMWSLFIVVVDFSIITLWRVPLNAITHHRLAFNYGKNFSPKLFVLRYFAAKFLYTISTKCFQFFV